MADREIEHLKECGRRRVAAGLPQFPPPGVGDLEEILSLRKQIEDLTAVVREMPLRGIMGGQ